MEMKNFWFHFAEASRDKHKPILCLAPMADVTDRAFRYLISKYSKIPHVTYTEFVSADGLFSGGYDALINDLAFNEIERPIVAQFFTSKPEMMRKAAALAVELGFDGVDINMGCPDKKVEKQGAGARLIKNPELAKEIITAAKTGIKEAAKRLNKEEIPVSVKTRLGYNKDELDKWLPEILKAEPAAIIIHVRTRKEMSKVPARWERIKRAVEIRNEMQGISDLLVKKTYRTLIIGNGDVESVEDAIKKCEETGADGAMLGRAVFGNPWLFACLKSDITVKNKMEALVEHAKLFEKLVKQKPPKGQGKSFAVMKKHFKAYVNGWDGAKELRTKLMEAESANEVEKIIDGCLARPASS
jgi:nifR3 family TIM-barrel protein